MRVRAVSVLRGLRRVALLLPVALTALALLMLPRPPDLTPAPRLTATALPTALQYDHQVQSIAITETEEDSSVKDEGDEVSRRAWFLRGGERRPRSHDPHAAMFPEDSLGDDRYYNKYIVINEMEEDSSVKDEGHEVPRRAWFLGGGERRPRSHDHHAAMFPEDSPGDDRYYNKYIVINEMEEDSSVKDEGHEVPLRAWFLGSGERRPRTHDPHAAMFPEDSPGDDRVVQQLMYTLPEDDDVPVKKILLANGLGAWNVPHGRTEFLRNKCPVDRCYLTADSREAATADAILYKDHHTPFNVKRPPKQIWILYYLECPYHTASLRPASVDVFNWTSTYRRDSDIVAPYERWVYHDPAITNRDLDRNYAANKTKKVAWFVSNCHARNRRLQYARQLSKYISVDIYGACGSHHCPRNDPNCLDMLDKDYKFYLAFENSNCRDYVTEKFFVNGMQHDVLPIVMGARASEYAAMAPHNSYIHVEEFAGAEELAAYLRRLDEDDGLYNSYFKWKGTGEFINTYFFCRVCAMVHANERRQRSAHYSDVQAWWRDSACTRTDWRGSRDPG